jgi:hypothetical protein
MALNPSEKTVRIKCSECNGDFQSRDDFEIHLTQQHGVDVGDIVRHFTYLEERMTTLENRK